MRRKRLCACTVSDQPNSQPLGGPSQLRIAEARLRSSHGDAGRVRGQCSEALGIVTGFTKGYEDSEQVYAAHWSVEAHNVEMTIEKPSEAHMLKILEREHMDLVEETETMVQTRRKRNTQTDVIFDDTIQTISSLSLAADDDAFEKNNAQKGVVKI